MSYTLVAHRYAKALFELSREKGQLEAVYDALQKIVQSINPSTDFYNFIHNPLLPLEVRVKVLNGIFGGNVPESLERFILYINAKNRLNILHEVIIDFDLLFLQLNNSIRGIVKTAQPFEQEQQQLINNRLNDKFAKNVILDWQIDQSLIGGFKIIVGDQLIDFSYKSQLEFYSEKVLN